MRFWEFRWARARLKSYSFQSIDGPHSSVWRTAPVISPVSFKFPLAGAHRYYLCWIQIRAAPSHNFRMFQAEECSLYLQGPRNQVILHLSTHYEKCPSSCSATPHWLFWGSRGIWIIERLPGDWQICNKDEIFLDMAVLLDLQVVISLINNTLT